MEIVHTMGWNRPYRGFESAENYLEVPHTHDLASRISDDYLATPQCPQSTRRSFPIILFSCFPHHTSQHNHLHGKRLSHSFNHLIHSKMRFGFRKSPSVAEFHATHYGSTKQAHPDTDTMDNRYAHMRQLQSDLDRINQNHDYEKRQIERRGSETMQDIRKKFVEALHAAEKQQRADLDQCKRRYTEKVMATFGSPPRYVREV